MGKSKIKVPNIPIWDRILILLYGHKKYEEQLKYRLMASHSATLNRSKKVKL